MTRRRLAFSNSVHGSPARSHSIVSTAKDAQRSELAGFPCDDTKIAQAGQMILDRRQVHPYRLGQVAVAGRVSMLYDERLDGFDNLALTLRQVRTVLTHLVRVHLVRVPCAG